MAKPSPPNWPAEPLQAVMAGRMSRPLAAQRQGAEGMSAGSGAPPVYRPQASVQAKLAPPPVYSPYSTTHSPVPRPAMAQPAPPHLIVQRQSACGIRNGAGAPPVYRPQATAQARHAAAIVPPALLGQSIQRMRRFSERPLPTLWEGWVGPEFNRRYPSYEGIATVVDAPPLPAEQYAVPGFAPPPVPQQVIFVPGIAPQQAVRVPTPKERGLKKAAAKAATTPAPSKSKRRFKGEKMALTAPDVGVCLNTVPITHAVFHDIVFFTPNNHPPYTEIHVHRDAMGNAVQISMKYTGMVGNGAPVPFGSALFVAAANAAIGH
jgi:hypothetical protein